MLCFFFPWKVVRMAKKLCSFRLSKATIGLLAELADLYTQDRTFVIETALGLLYRAKMRAMKQKKREKQTVLAENRALYECTYNEFTCSDAEISMEELLSFEREIEMEAMEK